MPDGFEWASCGPLCIGPSCPGHGGSGPVDGLYCPSCDGDPITEGREVSGRHGRCERCTSALHKWKRSPLRQAEAVSLF